MLRPGLVLWNSRAAVRLQVLARAKPLPGGSSPDVYGPRTMEQADPSRRRSVLRRHALTGDARSRRLSTSSRVAADSTPSRPDTAGFAASSQHKVASANERASQEATQPVGLQSRPAMTTRVVDMPQLPVRGHLSVAWPCCAAFFAAKCGKCAAAAAYVRPSMMLLTSAGHSHRARPHCLELASSAAGAICPSTQLRCMSRRP